MSTLRGLKLHQIKAKCQASENKLTGLDKSCFVSLTDILNISFLKFGDTIYCKTPSNTFLPICNFDKPISATQCFVETNDIVIGPIPEYFNDNISPCDSNDCLTCNSFISDQSFKSKFNWQNLQNSNLWAIYLWIIKCCLCYTLHSMSSNVRCWNWEKSVIKDKWASSRYY